MSEGRDRWLHAGRSSLDAGWTMVGRLSSYHRGGCNRAGVSGSNVGRTDVIEDDVEDDNCGVFFFVFIILYLSGFRV